MVTTKLMIPLCPSNQNFLTNVRRIRSLSAYSRMVIASPKATQIVLRLSQTSKLYVKALIKFQLLNEVVKNSVSLFSKWKVAHRWPVLWAANDVFAHI